MTKPARNLILFILATFTWTWLFYTPIALLGISPYQLPWMILLLCGGAGPSIMGVVMVVFSYDKAQRRDYWRRCFSVRRISRAWWFVIFLIFPLTAVVCSVIDMALGGPLPGMEQIKYLAANPGLIPLITFISFMSGPWSEEFGWRGYALDPMIERLGTLRGSVVLGGLWGVWHLPLFFMPATWHGQLGFGLTGFWMFIVYSIGLALIMTWVYRHTNRSILAAMLMHFTSNYTSQLFAPVSERVEVLRALLLLATGLVLYWLDSRTTRQVEAQPAPAWQEV